MKKLLILLSLLIVIGGGLIWLCSDYDRHVFMVRAHFDAESAYKLGSQYMDEGDNNKARYWLEKSADKGFAYAGFFLWQLYNNKNNIFYDDEKSQYYFKWSQENAQSLSGQMRSWKCGSLYGMRKGNSK